MPCSCPATLRRLSSCCRESYQSGLRGCFEICTRDPRDYMEGSRFFPHTSRPNIKNIQYLCSKLTLTKIAKKSLELVIHESLLLLSF